VNFPGFPAGITRPIVPPEGLGSSGILVIGEHPGRHEEDEGRPFVPWAEAGSVLERVLYRAGISREVLTITNLVPYRPPRDWLDGAPWEVDAIALGKRYLDKLVEERQPKVILALGGIALRELTGLAGEKCGIGMLRGFSIAGLHYDIPIVGSYHPSFLRRGSKEREEQGPKGKVNAAGGGTSGGLSFLGVLIRDLLLAADIAKRGAKRFEYDDYRLGATVEDWRAALAALSANRALPISYDFETADSLVASDESEMFITRRDVTQVQISWRTGQALVSPWSVELLPILKEILELPNPKMDWNGRKFDRPILRDMQVRCDRGEWHDLMDFWHHAQPDLPRGLQFATSFSCPEVGPWKHLSHSDPLWYGALDVDMPQRIMLDLQGKLSVISHPLSNISLARGYRDQVVRLAPVLDRMSARGIGVDEGKRLALDEEFTLTLARLTEECQGLYPEELKGVDPKGGFVRTPDEALVQCARCIGAKKIIPEGTKKKLKCPDCGGKGRIEHVIHGYSAGLVQREFRAEIKCGCSWSKSKRKGQDALVGENCSLCMNSGKRVESVLRWCRVEPFLPGSWQQVLRYMKWRREEDLSLRSAKRDPQWAEHTTPWVLPLDYKTGKPTTAADELRRLAKKTNDLLLPLIVEYKEIEKMRGTYVRGWKPGPDGRVHPNFGFKPSTGQLSSDNPNAQNFPAHGILAQKMKAMLVSTEQQRCDRDIGPAPLYCPLPKGHEGYCMRSDDPYWPGNKGNGQV